MKDGAILLRRSKHCSKYFPKWASHTEMLKTSSQSVYFLILGWTAPLKQHSCSLAISKPLPAHRIWPLVCSNLSVHWCRTKLENLQPHSFMILPRLSLVRCQKMHFDFCHSCCFMAQLYHRPYTLFIVCESNQSSSNFKLNTHRPAVVIDFFFPPGS